MQAGATATAYKHLVNGIVSLSTAWQSCVDEKTL